MCTCVAVVCADLLFPFDLFPCRYAQRAGRCCALNQMAHVLVVNILEPDEMETVSEVEKFCGIQMMTVKWERALLQCTLACNVAE